MANISSINGNPIVPSNGSVGTAQVASGYTLMTTAEKTKLGGLPAAGSTPLNSINGNPIVVDASGISDDAVPDDKLAQNGAALNNAINLRHPMNLSGYISGAGNVVANDSYVRTDYIPMVGSAIFCEDIYNGSSSRTVGFYDGQKNPLGTTGASVSGNLVVDSIPSGTVYVMVASRKTDGGGATLDPAVYVQESLSVELGELEIRTEDVEKSVAMALDATFQLSISGYLDTSGSFVASSNAMRTDFCAIGGYSKLEVTTKISSSGFAIAFFDPSKAIMSSASVAGNGNLTDYSLDVPEGAAYMVASYYSTSQDFSSFKAGAYNLNSLESRVRALETSVPNLGNPQILVFGDSITDNMDVTVDVDNVETTAYAARAWDNYYYDEQAVRHNYNMWPKLIQSKLTCSEVRNYALAGASYKTADRTSGQERRNLDFQVQLAINDSDDPNDVFGTTLDPDIVIFALGTNDGSPNDTPSSAFARRVLKSDGYTVDVDATLAALDHTKFCEAAMWAYLTVKKQWPYAQGYVVLPIQRTSSDNVGGDLHDYLKEIAGKFGYIVVDGYAESGITRELNTYDGLGTYLKDGLHPNDKGQNMMTRMVVAAINSHYVSFDGMNS